MSADIPPQQTIYVQNLYEKLRKEELRKSLYAIFGQFGKILDVVCLKTYRLRGQAWIVFADVASAVNAKNAMQGFPFFDKPMKLAFAKTKSDAVAKVDGTFTEASKKGRSARNTAAREALMKRGKGGAAAAAASTAAPAGAAAPVAKAPTTTATDGVAGPNRILFVQDLPRETNASMVNMLFQQFVGFKEVRMVDARPGIAFVEYETEGQATTAMNGLQDFKITPTNAIKISYAKQ